MICLDLTGIDDFLLDYANFLAGKFKPETITVLHIIEQTEIYRELPDLFPEVNGPEELRILIMEELEEKLDILSDSGAALSIILEDGNTTDTIIRVMNDTDPDLLVMGKKIGYEGEGVTSKKIARYVSCSVLFVPENARHQLQHILIPVNFNERSAQALQVGSSIAQVCRADITAQHIYKYPPQFFPGIPVDEFKEKMKIPLEKKLDKFRKDYSPGDNIRYIFTLNRNSKVPDKVYDQSVRDQSDMIIAGTKYRSTLANVLVDDLADRLIPYPFGIPLLIVKNKKEPGRMPGGSQ